MVLRTSALRRAPAHRGPAPPGFVRPCAPTRHDRPPKGAFWFHEIKQDGWRLIARKDGDVVRLWTRLRNECSDRFVAIAAAVLALPADTCTIDGEAVALRPDGHCDFHALRGRDGAAAATLVCFDLLELSGEDLRRSPIEERRARLAALVRTRRRRSVLTFSRGFDAEGADVFANACAIGLEGIVSKFRGSIYKSGASASWIKTLNPQYRRR